MTSSTMWYFQFSILYDQWYVAIFQIHRFVQPVVQCDISNSPFCMTRGKMWYFKFIIVYFRWIRVNKARIEMFIHTFRPSHVWPCVGVQRRMLLMIHPLPSVPIMSCSDDLWYGRKVAVQLLFCRVLLLGFCWKQHSESLFISHQAFSPRVSLTFFAGVFFWGGAAAARQPSSGWKFNDKHSTRPPRRLSNG